jgi:Na+/proline symporter
MIKKIIMWIMIVTFLNLVIAPEFVSASDETLKSTSNGITGFWTVVGIVGICAVVVGGIILLVGKATGSKSSEEKNENTKLASNNSVPKVYEEKDNFVTQSGELIILRW